MPKPRNRRISEEIKKIIGNILLFEIKDPRISRLASVTYVEVTNDLRYAYVYISCFDPNHNVDLTIDGLNSAKGFVRKEIGKALQLRYTPEPIFKVDNSIEHGMHINDIIGSLHINEEAEKAENNEDLPNTDGDEESDEV